MGTNRALSLLLAISVALLVSASGCKRRAGGLDLPRYPGANFMPRSHVESTTGTLFHAELHSPDDFRSVLAWYVTELSKLPGWSGPSSARDFATWSNGNMETDQNMEARPRDASKRGSMIMIMDTSGRTIVRMYDSIPKPPAQ